MNFLAHLYLAGKDEELLIGNFIADSVKGNKYKTYPERISMGILMHRAVDYFSDTNPVYLQSVHRLQPTYGKYSGVIVDMFYDYFLANNWKEFSNVSLNEFTKDMYRILSAHSKEMPKESRIILKHMIKSDWLYSYYYAIGIRLALEGMSKRMKYYFPMDNAVTELGENSELYEHDFFQFFPLLIIYTKQYLVSQSHPE